MTERSRTLRELAVATFERRRRELGDGEVALLREASALGGAGMLSAHNLGRWASLDASVRTSTTAKALVDRMPELAEEAGVPTRDDLPADDDEAQMRDGECSVCDGDGVLDGSVSPHCNGSGYEPDDDDDGDGSPNSIDGNARARRRGRQDRASVSNTGYAPRDADLSASSLSNAGGRAGMDEAWAPLDPRHVARTLRESGLPLKSTRRR
jgi:hypothetical protein